ncbi:MAG TPA: serine/threonine-protein kinase [Pseudonocardiaceae bacterium]|jgi:serine/threonine protein kinase|nr:serine/threonine-protein kinase [Pseudonocardiaceae bacterium]
MDVSYDVDDGLPVWRCRAGAALPGGTLAVDRLGVGTRCETWLAWSVEQWCPVVVKVVRPHQVQQPRAIRSLSREVTALSDAAHPALSRLLHDGTDDDLPYLLLEYVDGPALDEALDDTGPMAVEDAALLCAQLLAGIADLHRRGMAHLDLKPANVMLRDGHPVVVDFGSARRIGASQPNGRPIGTPGYAAPEQEMCEPISTTMDCYAVGVILYEAVTGDTPGQSSELVAVPPVLRRAVHGLLAPDPERRMTIPVAMRALAETVPADRRPWPRWADRHLRLQATAVRLEAAPIDASAFAERIQETHTG